MPKPQVYTGAFARCVDAFIDKVMESKRVDPLSPVVALVGSNAMRREIRDRLHHATGGTLGVYALTFKDLADRLAAHSLLSQGQKPLEKLYHLALLRGLVKGSGGYFQNVAHFDGIAHALCKTFEDVDEAGWENIPVKAASSPKIKEVARIFDQARRKLDEDGFYAMRDLFEIACAQAPKFPKLFQCENLHVVGLYDLNAQQKGLLESLAKHIRLHLYIPGVPYASAWALNNGIEKTSFFVADPDITRIFSCPSPAGEVREIIREAVRLRHLADAPIPYHKMGVLLRHADAYADLFALLAAEAHAPCHIHGGCSPVNSRGIRLLKRLADLLDFDESKNQIEPFMKRREVISFLTAFRPPKNSAWPSDIDRMQRTWDFISRESHIRNGSDWRKQLTRFANNKRNSHLAREAGGLQTAAEKLSEGLTKTLRAKSYHSAAAHFQALSRAFIEPDESCKKAMEKIDELGTIDKAGEAVEPARLRSLVAAIIGEVKDGAGCADPAGIRVIDMAASRGLTFEVVFIPGCVDGMIPHLGKPDPIFLDHERKILNQVHPENPLPLFADRPRNERNLFDAACRSATKRLVFTFHRIDADMGKPRMPSNYLLGIFGETASLDDFLRDHVTRIHASAPLSDSGEFPVSAVEKDLALLKSLTSAGPAAPVMFLQKAHPHFQRVWRKQTHRWANNKIGPWEALCASDESKSLLADYFDKDGAFRVTGIESYIKCPRRYLLESILKLQSPETPEDIVALPADKRGSLIHKILAAVEENKLGPDEWIARVKKDYAEYIEDNLTGTGALAEIERDRLIEWTGLFAELLDAGRDIYKKAECEKPVSVNIPLDDKGKSSLILKGRLDRLDIDERGKARIVDFKTGRSSNSLSGKTLSGNSFNAGATMQMPLYMMAMIESGDEYIDMSLEAAYWYLKDAKGNVGADEIQFNEEFIEKNRGALKRILAMVAEGMRAGRFVPRPDVAGKSPNSFCSYCDYKYICDGLCRKFIAYCDPDGKFCPWLSLVNEQPVGRNE